MQLDGEYYESKTNIFKISILEGSLKVVN